ncbi:MAG TPA: DUF2848 family protein [Opitutaceae bacterium]|nr:DUF2848 family protein [Opitutaceae bacterium]
MSRLVLDIVRPSGTTAVVFEPRRMINAGYVGRDQAAVRQHIEELRREGVAPPPSVPMLYPMALSSLTTDSRIEVVEPRTSGEIEFVLLVEGCRVLVGVGSDHTDRLLETTDVLKSKQACANVMGRAVWDYEDLRDHWDRLQLQSSVRASSAEIWKPYQSASVASILAPEQILELVRSRMTDHCLDRTLIFSGTIPLLDGKMIYGSEFQCALIDPVLNRTLHCAYEVVHLNYLTRHM